jgi:hypothetical protein
MTNSVSKNVWEEPRFLIGYVKLKTNSVLYFTFPEIKFLYMILYLNVLKTANCQSQEYFALRCPPFWRVTQRRLVVTDVSGQPMRPVFKAQVVKVQSFFLDYLTLQDEKDRLNRNVGNYHSTLCDILEERRCLVHRYGRQKLRTLP